jgi:hypothetical protein
MPDPTIIELSQLVNAKVTAIARDPDDNVYGLKFDTGVVAWILQDPEGNGPGHLEVEQLPR